MIDMLNAVVEAKQSVENNIDNLSSNEIENLMLFEQLSSLEQAENALRSAIKTGAKAKKDHPEMFINVPKPILIT